MKALAVPATLTELELLRWTGNTRSSNRPSRTQLCILLCQYFESCPEGFFIFHFFSGVKGFKVFDF